MLRKEEIENVTKLNAIERYKYFIKRTADYEELWTLGDNDGYAISEVDDKKLLTFCSAKEYITFLIEDAWAGYQPIKLTLDEFEKKIIPIIDAEGYLLNIFPIGNKSGFIVSIEEFIRDLNIELEKYQ